LPELILNNFSSSRSIHLKVLQVVWLKRDLRSRDHAPLFEAAQRGPVLPLYVYEPSLWSAPDAAPRHWNFVAESLRDLRRRLPVVVRVGEVLPVLEEIRRTYGIAGLWAHEETTNWMAYQRDRAVRRWAREAGVPFTELPGSGVVRRLRSRNGWAAAWETLMGATPVPEVSGFAAVPGMALGDLPRASAALQQGGESAAWETLESFLHQRGRNYSKELSSPLTAFDACSRISAHLAWGTLSMRETVQATRRRMEAAPEWKRPLRAFDARLHWRSHFMQKIEDEPQIEFRNFVTAFDGMREPHWNDEYFAAWCEGRTGYGMVDACMRALRATGWINFRMRAMLVSFASYHLWLHWPKPAAFLAQQFTDYEPGIHYSQFQMQSGTTGINTLRIYSPDKQAEDHDPDGEFVRRWVPEGVGPRIVEHAAAYKLARARMAEFRRQPEMRAQAKAVQVKHGSRKKPAARPRQQSLF
jgi:deoxyribodipyrimidine photo-lyase